MHRISWIWLTKKVSFWFKVWKRPLKWTKWKKTLRQNSLFKRSKMILTAQSMSISRNSQDSFGHSNKNSKLKGKTHKSLFKHNWMSKSRKSKKLSELNWATQGLRWTKSSELKTRNWLKNWLAFKRNFKISFYRKEKKTKK